MALPEDQKDRLRCYRNALRNWNYEGYVVFKGQAQQRLPEYFANLSPREIAHELHLFVESGGEIDEQKERRPEWNDYEFHFDLRVAIGGRRIYFETLLLCQDADDPDDPIVVVVNFHDV